MKKLFKEEDFPEGVSFSPYLETVTYMPRQKEMICSFLIKKEYRKQKKQILIIKTRHLSDSIEKRIETSKVISKEVYNQFVSQKDDKKRIINKQCCEFRMEDEENVFIYKIENFILDEGNFSILHLTSNIKKKNTQVPCIC